MGIRTERLPVHLYDVSPEAFEVVQLPGVFCEDMQNNIPIVSQNPIAVFALDVATACALAFHQYANFLCNRIALPLIGGGRNNEIVKQRRDFSDIEYNDIFAFEVFTSFCTQAGTFQTGRTFNGIRLLRRFGVDFGNLWPVSNT